MARNRGPSFDERIARVGLTPQQRETGAATLLLAELVAEMVDQLHEQNDRLAEQNKLLEEIRDGRTITVNTAVKAPSAAPEKGDDVQLREPAVPPPDPDGDDTAPAKPATRRTATKATAGKAPTKNTAAARRSTAKG